MHSSYKILIADDSDSYLRIIQQIFEVVSSEYELIFAHNGKEACDKAIEQLPDLILLDVLMPEMNGIEAAKFLKDNKSTKDTPIILLSATESLQAAYEVGVDDFISKPFNQYELLIKVRSALDLVNKIKEIERHKKELEIRNSELIKNNAILEEQRNDLTADLRYSKRIQTSVLSSDNTIKNIIPDHFVLNLPRNVVSGDFYWVGKHGNRKVIAVADCTGHGISGAFMTMAGIAFLNDILSNNYNLMPEEVLFKLREMVMELLKQTGEEGEASDGMDISLTILDEEYEMLYFAGANNPLYIMRNGELLIYKGDRMPIGIHLNFQRPFTNNKIPVYKGDTVYLFSDGYADQFGGPRNKKFRYKQFQDLIVEHHEKPMEKQKEILEKTFLDWKGEQFQVDDILVLGYKIN